MSPHQQIENRIAAAAVNLPQNQKKVADFFLENLHLLAILSIHEIAQKAQVSEASIVRCSKSLGYNGFKELKAELSQSMQNRLSPTQWYALASENKEPGYNTLQRVSRNVQNNIQETVKHIDLRQFNNAVRAIIKAKTIYCLGLEISSSLAQMMTFLLRLYTYRAHYLTLDHMHYSEQVMQFTSQDLLIAFSFSPYSRETVEALQLAKKIGLPTITFTDKKSAPAFVYSTHTLCIKTDNIMFSNSLAAITMVMNAIINELNFKDRRRTLHALKTIEDNIKDERYFILSQADK